MKSILISEKTAVGCKTVTYEFPEDILAYIQNVIDDVIENGIPVAEESVPEDDGEPQVEVY